jgi:hypothetical protein
MRLALALAAVAGGCRPAMRGAGEGTAGTSAAASRIVEGPPVLVSLHPDTARVGDGAVVEIVVRGRGFDTSRAAPANMVLVGDVELAGVPAASARELRFAVPLTITSGGEAPPRPIEPGAYDVRVRVRGAISNPLRLQVMR